MAIVPLVPIGASRKDAIDDRDFAEYREVLEPLEDKLRARREEVHAGWGDKYVKRVHQKGKLTTRERITKLIDPGTEIFEIGTFVNYGVEFGERSLRSPGAGVVTAFARIHGRYCMIIANDNTVASGSWWPRTPEKIQRAQTIALRMRLPTVYLVDCSGLFLPEQSKSFPGGRGAGHIFKMNSLLSDNGVPQVAGVFGDCIAGGGYMPLISDRVYMTEQAYMVIAGAALIKGAKSQMITSLDIGGPEVHVHRSRCADVRVPNDDVLLACIRRDISQLPSSAADYYRGGVGAMDPAYPAEEICGLLPPDHREAYDAKQILARICDQSLFWEVLSDVGDEMICGVGRIGGLYAGFIINRQGLVNDPEHTGRQRPSAILYRQGIAKISAFSRACNEDGIPIVWLQDISGFDVGLEAEARGLLGYGSSLIYTNSTNDVPMFTVLLRKASGAGYYAMAGLPYDPVLQLSTCVSRLSVMEGRTLAIATYNSKLDDEFEIVTTDPDERKKIEDGMAGVASRIEADMDPYVSARQLDTDEIIATGELRDYLAMLIEASYQSIGYRRVKNPRIWSLHDLDVLVGGVRATPRTGKGAPEILTAILKRREDGRIELLSPGVGLWRDAPENGALVSAGAPVGKLEVLGELIALRAPEAAHGLVVDRGGQAGLARCPVGYGDALLVLDPEATASVVEEKPSATNDVGDLVFCAPSSGRFYARPAPEKPLFVNVGDTIESGQTVAILEVMKTFNRVQYGGPGLPTKARVTRIVPADGDDLGAGDVLLELEAE